MHINIINQSLEIFFHFGRKIDVEQKMFREIYKFLYTYKRTEKATPKWFTNENFWEFFNETFIRDKYQTNTF